MALFDFHGKALPSLKVFKLVASNNEVPDLSLVSVEDVKAKLAAGTRLELPKSTLAAFSDYSIRSVQVRWDQPNPEALKSIGTVEVKGNLLGYGNPVTATVEVVVDVNLIKDASFESGTLPSEWQPSGPGVKAAAPVEKNPGNERRRKKEPRKRQQVASGMSLASPTDVDLGTATNLHTLGSGPLESHRSCLVNYQPWANFRLA